MAPIAMGLGARDGYSGMDLTNPKAAVFAGEVPFLAADGTTPDADPVLELRIHGIGGAPATDNLETPATVQVAGDGTAGFHRAWYPGGSAAGRPRREAYCWGGLNTRATSRALWLLLVGFMLVNVAHWALPAERGRAAGLGRAIVRLLGLALTLAFVGTAITMIGDLIAWQAPRRGVLPSWLGWFSDLTMGPRVAVGLLAVLVVLAVLTWLSVQTVRSYEKWGAAAHPDEERDWPLTRASFWCGERVVTRQRTAHVAAACAEVLAFAALPHHAGPARTVLLVLAAAVGAVAVALVASRWTDRIDPAGGGDRAACVAAGLAVALATGACVADFWWDVDAAGRSLPGDQVLPGVLVYAQFALLALLAAVVLVQRPWRAGSEVMARGFAAPLLAAFGCLVATIFGASLTLAVTNLLGTPRAMVDGATASGETLLLPPTVYAGGLAMVAALVFVLLLGATAAAWARIRAASLARTEVPASYPDPGGPAARRQVASVWARSELTDRAGAGLAWLAVPTGAVLVGYLLALDVEHNPAAVARLAALGGTVGVAATLLFLAQLRSALTNPTARRRFGALWDVGTFWPRACHPFAPPCYAERTIPEVVTRVRRITGDRVRGSDEPAVAQQDAEDCIALCEQQSPVLLTGYSQGTPISVAVMAQLPQEVRERTALLLLAAPVRRLYGRAFPAYFGPDQLARISRRLTSGGECRWRTLVRHSDFVGGPAFSPGPHGRLVDREVLDPPVLWPDHDPSPPPIHRHSDFFPDPQVRPYTVELSALLRVGDRVDAAMHADGIEQLSASARTDVFGGREGAREQDNHEDHISHASAIPGPPRSQTPA